MTPGTLMHLIEAAITTATRDVDEAQRKKNLLVDARQRMRLGVSEEEVLANLRAKGVVVTDLEALIALEARRP